MSAVRPLQWIVRLAVAAALVGLLAGCAGGLIGPLPVVTNPKDAATVTVFRDGSLVGIVGPIILRIDDRKTYKIWRNQRFIFRLDPGDYVFYYTIGFNECRRIAFIEPHKNYLFRLAPNCSRFDGPF